MSAADKFKFHFTGRCANGSAEFHYPREGVNRFVSEATLRMALDNAKTYPSAYADGHLQRALGAIRANGKQLCPRPE